MVGVVHGVAEGGLAALHHQVLLALVGQPSEEFDELAGHKLPLLGPIRQIGEQEGGLHIWGGANQRLSSVRRFLALLLLFVGLQKLKNLFVYPPKNIF